MARDSASSVGVTRFEFLSPASYRSHGVSDGLKELKNPEFSGFSFLTASHVMSGCLGKVGAHLGVSTA